MSARTIPDRDQLAARAVALRLADMPYRAIGRRLGISAMTAMVLCREATQADGPHAEQLRAVELGRLDRQIEALAARRTRLATITPGGPGHHDGVTR